MRDSLHTSCHWTDTDTHKTHTHILHFCSSMSDCFTLLYKNATNHVQFLLYFSMWENSRLCYLLLLKSCLIRHVGNLLWQKSVVKLHNMECKPTFCDVSCLKEWPYRQTRNWGISSQYFFFRALQTGNFDDNCTRHVCVWRRDTLKTTPHCESYI